MYFRSESLSEIFFKRQIKLLKWIQNTLIAVINPAVIITTVKWELLPRQRPLLWTQTDNITRSWKVKHNTTLAVRVIWRGREGRDWATRLKTTSANFREHREGIKEHRLSYSERQNKFTNLCHLTSDTLPPPLISHHIYLNMTSPDIIAQT